MNQETQTSPPAADPSVRLAPIQPLARPRPRELTDLRNRIALITGIGIGGFVALIVFGHASLGPTLAGAAILGITGLLIYLNAVPEIEAEADRATMSTAPIPPTPSFDPSSLHQILGAMPDAAFAIDQDGRLAGANGLARSQFNLPSQGQFLASSLREPRLVEAALSVAGGSDPQSVPFASAGSLEAFFRAQIAGFSIDGKKLALIVVHDETAAKKVERMRVDFLANASHELRTPLAAVVGSIETLTGHAQNDPVAQARFFKLMQSQADRMRRLIDDLLSLSKIELNEHIPPQGEADLGSIVRETVDTLTPIAVRKGVTLTVKRLEGGLKVLGNRDELIQVTQNLIDNAIKYARADGNVEIEVGGIQRDSLTTIKRKWPDAAFMSLAIPVSGPSTHMSYLRVTDDGPGMPRESLPRLSERFYRVEEMKNSDRVGTGLGLAIVKHIINRHRGGLYVESQLGQGSAFTACIPSKSDD